MSIHVYDEPWKEPDKSINMICGELSTSDLGQAGKEIEKIMGIDDTYKIQLVATAFKDR